MTVLHVIICYQNVDYVGEREVCIIDLDSQCHMWWWSFFIIFFFSVPRIKVVARFDDIDEIVDHHCINLHLTIVISMNDIWIR